ncbi:MAG: pyruvate kinase [Sorangiineae bacterium NIC37A_2]|jgi:pyruvate kinase|nr:MAG: pyruvate kinase [Sorangiineae bacterium NIC37A_2]
MTTQAQRRDFRHTKIICTLGPASSTPEILREMAAAGMNIARFNFSHGNHESHGKAFSMIDALNKELNHPIAKLLDTQGPEIRTGERQNPLVLEPGMEVTLSVSPDDAADEQYVYVAYKDLVTDLKAGDRITIDNGIINVDVLEITGARLRCKVIDGGKVGSRRHVNLPGIRVNLPSITEKDYRDIEFGLKNDVDIIALSFVRSADDIRECRRIVEAAGKKTRIFAKIENQEGVDNFDEILAEADGIMVARGDLGVEIQIRDLPIRQRRMVQACSLAGKPVIVATHLLESMITSPTPTRAEVSDVANAVFEGADCIMLSGETGAGKYPVKCVQIMDSIARRMEKEPSIGFHLERKVTEVRDHLARAACSLADSLNSRAIVVTSRSGRLAEIVSSFRPRTAIIYACTDDESARRRLWAVRSVVPIVIQFNEEHPELTVASAMTELRRRNRLLPGDHVVVVSDIQAGPERIEAIQVRTFAAN